MAKLMPLLPLLLAGCVPVVAPGRASEPYRAIGQEPGWMLTIDGERIEYTGNYGEVRIAAARPNPRATANGRRYDTPRLKVDITNTRCNDAMSGHGYADQVVVVADGKSFTGCGGTRRTDWDQ